MGAEALFNYINRHFRCNGFRKLLYRSLVVKISMVPISTVNRVETTQCVLARLYVSAYRVAVGY